MLERFLRLHTAAANQCRPAIATTVVVLLPLAGMGTDNPDIASIEGLLILVPWVGGTEKEKINNLLWQEIR